MTLRPPGSRAAASLVVVVLAALGAGCERTPAEKVQANLQKVRDEQAPEKLLARGQGFASVGDLTRAEEYLVAALDAGAKPRETIASLLDVCVRAGKYRVAIQYASAFLRKHPGDDRTRFVLGTLHAAVGDAPSARAELERVVTLKPHDASARWTLGVLLRDQLGDPVAADAHFRAYLVDAPGGEHAEEARESLLRKVAALPEVALDAGAAADGEPRPGPRRVDHYDSFPDTDPPPRAPAPPAPAAPADAGPPPSPRP